MKKVIYVVVALVLIFAFASCKKVMDDTAQAALSAEQATPSVAPAATSEPAAQLPNPIVPVEGSADFDKLGFIITPYQSAEEIAYSIIGGTVAQINFTLQGESYTYRGAKTTDDISGVYETFDQPAQSLQLDGPDFVLNVSIQTINGGADGALATWDFEDVRYSFYTPDPTDYDEMTDVLLPILYTDFPFAACCG